MGSLQNRLRELNVRKQELEEEMKSLSVKSSKALNEFLVISQLDSEKKVLRRKHFDTNIRIKNIEREIVNRSKTLSRVSESSVMMKNDNKVTKNCDNNNHDNVIVNVTTSDDDENDSVSTKAQVPCDIDPDDDEFDPTETQLPRVRPLPEQAPALSLPHSRRRWRLRRRVGGNKASTNGCFQTSLSDIGQFTSVEDEETIDWKSMGSGKSSDGVEGLRNPNFTAMCWNVRDGGTCKYGDSCMFAHHVLELHQTAYKEERLSNEVSNKEVEEENFVTAVEDLSDCICGRKADRIVCSSAGCGHTFTGRLAASCPAHPHLLHLMDHPAQCPRCGGDLVGLELPYEEEEEEDFKHSTIVKDPGVTTSTPFPRKQSGKRVVNWSSK